MKVIPVMEVRKSLGRILDEVNYNSETFILERLGKPVAMLVPLSAEGNGQSTSLAMNALRDLKSLNHQTERGDDPDLWLENERENWT